jgi:hypothetical protein
MSPALSQLLEEVGCNPAPKPCERQSLARVVAACSRLVGFIHTRGFTPEVPLFGREIAELAAASLPTQTAASFAPLSKLDETLAENPRWNFIDAAAHISSIARDAVQRSQA